MNSNLPRSISRYLSQLTLLVTVLLPEKKTKDLIDHLAKYVIKEGPPFEVTKMNYKTYAP